MGRLDHHPWVRAVLNTFSPFIYNPRATLNRIGDLYADWQERAAHRQLDQLDACWKRFNDEQSRPSIKNVCGRWLGPEMIPAYDKVIANYWRNQDQRAALLDRLAKL
jgi:hypothetical protein